MKKVLAFLAVTIVLASCGGNTAKFKPMIEELAANWDNTTSAVTEFSTMVKNEQSEVLNLANNLQVDPAVMEKWDEGATSKYNNIQSMTQSSSNSLASISSELDAFVTSWMEKSKELQALKDGLAAGKLEGDVQGKINALTTTVSEATTKLESWKDQFGKIKSAIADASSMFSEFKSSNLSDVR
jgi:flagellar biosynthesis/type III secretory pathway protein FliH